MKKIMLGLIAAFALASFGTPARAEEGGADAPKAEKKAGKKKKGAKKEGDAAPAGDDAAKK